MGYRDWQIATKIMMLVAVLVVLLVPWEYQAATFQHFFYQVRKTNGDVAPGVNVTVFAAGSAAQFTIFSNITGTTVKSQPMLSDSLGMIDFYVGDATVDILFQGGTVPTQKLLNVTLSSLATLTGVLTVPNGGTGANSFTVNTVLLGNGTLPIKTSSVGLANQVFRVPAAGGQPDFGAVNLSSSAAVTGVLPIANGGTGTTSGTNLSVQEVDGSPLVSGVNNIKVSNGTLTDNTGGSVTIATGSFLPVVDTTSIVEGSADPTKEIRFEVDGLTTATTRILTPPNANITIAGTDFANVWADGVKQVFNPSGTTAGLNVGAHTVDPSVPVNGDQFYNSTSNKFRCYENGAWANCIGSGGTPGGADTNVQFNDGGVFGGESNFIWNKTAKFFGIGATASLMDEAVIVTNLASHNGVIASLRANDTAPPGNSAGFRAYKARNTVAAPAAVQSGDWLLGLSSNAYDGAGYFGQARLFSEATENWSGTNRGVRWVFSTTPNASTVITDTVRIPHDGGVQLLTGTKPTCDSTKRGYLYHVASGAGVADTYEACDKDSADVYAWRNIHASGSNPDLAAFSPGNNTIRNLYTQIPGVATTLVTSGAANLCDTGLSVTSVIAPAKVTDSSGTYIRSRTDGTSGQRASFVCLQDQVRTDWPGEITFRIKTAINDDSTDVRMFIGLESADISDSATSEPQAHLALFRYATDVDGTSFWRAYTNDNDASNTTTVTTAAFAHATAYLLRIRWGAGGTPITFYVDDVLVATHTTNLPSSSTPLGPVVSVKALAAEQKEIHWAWANMWVK